MFICSRLDARPDGTPHPNKNGDWGWLISADAEVDNPDRYYLGDTEVPLNKVDVAQPLLRRRVDDRPQQREAAPLAVAGPARPDSHSVDALQNM